ncbi:antibiotic biosynthesis monooxygenase [Nostocaceae cyanobacterium CENA357]|uniref:Antibiotic biosynthesis monooxygenase n=1 Tax=Atlanticothrix silvestris CENA357 TaxID=1725252 RepID=A0A8J7HFZ8_9CYAN|nr:antibiotic biosynthesis monooxygenase [Atlanticothrix silvestris]MBH8554384.1 antibiotic biosynthesis monooxygenase [Atlanticothrix silvestris CENA357]
MDFQDFLRHKFAHVAIGEFKPGKFETAKKLYEEAVLTYTNGFKGAYLLQEPGTDKGISVIFWESVEEMTANQNEAYQSILKKMMPLFTEPPETVVYELVCEIKPIEES